MTNAPALSRGTKRYLVGALLLLAACRGSHAEDPPIVPIRGPIYNQPRFDPMAESDLFPDRRAMRPVPAGTVAQGSAKQDERLSFGKNPDGSFISGFPVEVTLDVLKRGEERFNIYCAPCHGITGAGDGMVSKRGYAGVANLHDARIRDLPEGDLYNTIAAGKNLMPSYALQLKEGDRWAVVAYLRALQKSQNAALTDLTDAERAQLSAK
jgi:mono/diheme cytochrome c family protein